MVKKFEISKWGGMGTMNITHFIHFLYSLWSACYHQYQCKCQNRPQWSSLKSCRFDYESSKVAKLRESERIRESLKTWCKCINIVSVADVSLK